MPNEFLVISPGTRLSWGLIGRDNEALIVQVGERLSDGKRSRNCSVTAVNADFGRLRTGLERQFQLRKLGDVKQGSSDVTIYNATLIGYPNFVSVGLRLMRDSQRPETFLTLSMFEVAGF
ncbi:MAG: hypothetical protein INF87_09310 [Roseomonas sp.]|nr:hypothetical protein [Roseomonas sp.]